MPPPASKRARPPDPGPQGGAARRRRLWRGSAPPRRSRSAARRARWCARPTGRARWSACPRAASYSVGHRRSSLRCRAPGRRLPARGLFDAACWSPATGPIGRNSPETDQKTGPYGGSDLQREAARPHEAGDAAAASRRASWQGLQGLLKSSRASLRRTAWNELSPQRAPSAPLS